VCFPVVASAPEPILHSMNGSGRPEVLHELQVIVVLVLVCFLLVASAPEPVLHCKNGGGVPVEEHGVASSPEPVLHSMSGGG